MRYEDLILYGMPSQITIIAGKTLKGLYRRIVIEAEGESRGYLVSRDQSPRNFGFPDWDSVKLSTLGALSLSLVALQR